MRVGLPLLAVTGVVASPSNWLTVPSSNAVPACGATCTSLPSMNCIGSLPSASACQQSCASVAAGGCGVWTWSASTTHCWHRLDIQWSPEPWSNVTAGCRSVSSPGASCVPGCGGCAVDPNVSVKLGKPVGVRVSPHTPAVTLDWCAPAPTPAAAVVLVPATDPVWFTKGLAPAILRMGGSPLDSIEYDFDGTCERGKGTPGGSPSFTCSQTGVEAYGCFTPDRWRQFLAFGKATGLKLVFGLNACNGRTSLDSPMNFTNIQRFLTFTASLPADELTALHGFEFGNEVLNTGVTGTRWALDANTLAGMLRTTFGAAKLPIPPLMGPDHYTMNGYTDVLKALNKDTLAAVTYHDYPQCMPAQAEGMVLDPGCLGALDSEASGYANLIASAGLPEGTEIWDGEGADHTATGADFGHSFLPTFQSSMYYAWLQGVLPLNGVSLAARQCFIGGNYGLLNHSTFLPNPDFFVAWTYRQLFDTVLQGNVQGLSLNSSVPASFGLRAFAFTGQHPTAVVAVLVNLSTRRQWSVSLQPNQQRRGWREQEQERITAEPRTEWHFVGFPNENATAVTVNGELLRFDGSLPSLASLGRHVDSASPIVVAPASIVFVAL